MNYTPYCQDISLNLNVQNKNRLTDKDITPISHPPAHIPWGSYTTSQTHTTGNITITSILYFTLTTAGYFTVLTIVGLVTGCTNICCT